MKTITVLIPAYNEEAVLPQLFKCLKDLQKTIKKYYLEFLFINDSRSDSTLHIIKKEAGFDYTKVDTVVIIDDNLQDPPEIIPQMIKLWKQGYDDVYARRRSRKGETWLKKKTSEWYYRILQKSTRTPIQRDTGDFRLLDRRCIEALRLMRESQRNTKALFSWIGFNKKELLYDRDPRAAGDTKWNYNKLINLAIDGVTSFTTAPLRMSSVLGMIISCGAFLYILYLLIRPLFGVPTGAGYSSLMAVILFLGGIQLISLGIIGEYIARIFSETKNRPSYFVAEYYESKGAKREK